MAYTSMTFLALAAISVNLFIIARGSAFLANQERMSEEEVQMSLLAEVEGTFGEGSASSRVKQLEAGLTTMYAALPKNEQGYLGHATVRYALHRLFVQRHGWFIKGLDARGQHRNSTAAGLLKEQVPAYIQDLFEKRLGGRGFGLHELAVLGATIEHLVHKEAIKRLGDALKVHDIIPTSIMDEKQADEVLDTYMTSYILGEDLSKMTIEESVELKAEMPDIYNHWNETKEFVRTVRQNIIDVESSLQQKSSGDLDFSLVARVAERVGEQFGGFQNEECKDIKNRLVAMDERGTGRVKLSDFHSPAEDGSWQFQESVGYLRQLGALDESDDSNPRVIIANYITSPSNCIAYSSFYRVCCMDECESLIGHLEKQVAAPEASAETVAMLVAELSSSSVAAPRTLSSALLDRLNQSAAEHGGKVPLHGRLFTQWMHHAFPRECQYPHVSGTTNPLTPDEYEQATGEDTVISEDDMKLASSGPNRTFAETMADDFEVTELLPWSPEEELLVVRPPQMQAAKQSSLCATVRSALLLAAMMIAVYGFLDTLHTPSSAPDRVSAEKYFV